MSMPMSEAKELLRGQWFAALKSVLASMMPDTFDVAIQDAAGEADGEDRDAGWSWHSQLLSLSPAAKIWAGATDESWAVLSKALLGLDEVTSSDSLSTCSDIVSQSNSALVQALTKRFGSQITCDEIEPAEPPEGSPSVVLSVSAAILPRPVSILVSFDESIYKELSRMGRDEPAELRPAPKIPTAISDLRLNLYATLGRTELTIDNILKLNVGSVIDIGKSVTDFVEVVANGKVIASGQVVAFRGNYAIKVVSTKSKVIVNPAVFQGTGGPVAASDSPQSGQGTGGYDG